MVAGALTVILLAYELLIRRVNALRFLFGMGLRHAPRAAAQPAGA